MRYLNSIYTSFLEFKENLLDIVFVLTPSGSHFQIVKFLLKRKINVLCEKPLTLLLNQTLELEKLAKKNKLILSVAFQNRLNPAVVFLKNCLDKKKFGKIVKASIVNAGNSLSMISVQDAVNSNLIEPIFIGD